jgi:hypothetical protein
LCVAWVAWLLGSFQVLPLTRLALALGVVALATVSGIVWSGGAGSSIPAAHWRGIRPVESPLALFPINLLIRLGNPDLWHPYYGGEKP